MAGIELDSIQRGRQKCNRFLGETIHKTRPVQIPGPTDRTASTVLLSYSTYLSALTEMPPSYDNCVKKFCLVDKLPKTAKPLQTIPIKIEVEIEQAESDTSSDSDLGSWFCTSSIYNMEGIRSVDDQEAEAQCSYLRSR
jgi:hypothetical protein